MTSRRRAVAAAAASVPPSQVRVVVLASGGAASLCGLGSLAVSSLSWISWACGVRCVREGRLAGNRVGGGTGSARLLSRPFARALSDAGDAGGAVTDVCEPGRDGTLPSSGKRRWAIRRAVRGEERQRFVRKRGRHRCIEGPWYWAEYLETSGKFLEPETLTLDGGSRQTKEEEPRKAEGGEARRGEASRAKECHTGREPGRSRRR
jgi:hypothetical protein